METKGNLIRTCDLFEWTIKAIEKGRLSKEAEEKTLINLEKLEWIKQLFNAYPKSFLEGIYRKIVKSTKDTTMSHDVMSISCMYYNFNMIGVDTSELRELINSSEYVQLAVEEMQAARN